MTQTQYLWHPCAQMKDYETFKPLLVSGAGGCWLQLEDGHRVLDVISSWWCQTLGHGNTRIKQALMAQSERFAHVMLGNIQHETINQLSERLAQLSLGLDKVMYASDGSCAVEIALKMSLHARQIQGQPLKTQVMRLANGYHGETIMTMAVSDCDLYSAPYQPWMVKMPCLQGVPYVSGEDDPVWQDCSEQWPALEQQLEVHKDTLTAVIMEPLLQGAGGMQLYSADFLRRLREWSVQNDVHLIADEIMTGMGRTGQMLACDYANIVPDFLCLGKGLTSGWLPMSAMLTNDAIYQLFYDDYATGKAFLHSHTHTGNALAAAIAVEVLNILDEEPILQQVRSTLGPSLGQGMQTIAEQTGKLKNIRQLGAMVAADLAYTGKPPAAARLGYQVYQRAVELGVFLRPLGDTLYWLPPLTMAADEVNFVTKVTAQAIDEVCGRNS